MDCTMCLDGDKLVDRLASSVVKAELSPVRCLELTITVAKGGYRLCRMLALIRLIY